MKEIYIPAKNINPCQFITDPLNVKNYYPHTKASGQLDVSFENESIKVVIITNLEEKQKSTYNAENITDLPKTLQVPSLSCFS